MTISFAEVYAILVAERSRDPAVIRKAIETVMAANPETILLEIDQTFRDAGSGVYLTACPDKTYRVITGGMPAMLAAVAAVGMSAEQNRAALADHTVTA
jgi:hypothetical protein